jgi:predicted dienelactone hydrolase
VLDSDLVDASRGRTFPVRLRVPQPCAAGAPRPLVVFSHGLGGSRDGGALWGAHWASHGLAVIHLQHPGSDEALWRGAPGGFARFDNLRRGMTVDQYVARALDVRAALDAVAALAASDPALRCIDASRVGMSGHSFGAQTTQAVAGQTLPRPGGGPPAPWLAEPRIAAAVAFSPSVPAAGAASLLTVAVPLLAITGSRDGDVAGTGATPERRRAVFDALPASPPAGGPLPRAALLWFDGADHLVFNGGGPARVAPGFDRPALERAVAATTTAWWLAALARDADARAWLAGDGPRSLLGAADDWRTR